MADHTAFFYGTLMAPGVLYRVIYGSAKPLDHQKAFLSIRPALLPGFSRHRVRYADYPGIVPLDAGSQSGSVLGTFVTGLTPMDIKRLDTFEGSDYERRDVRAKVLTGSVDEVLAAASKGQDQEKRAVLKEVDTQSYVFLDKDQLEDAPWDFEQFKKEKLRFWAWEPNAEFDDLGHDESAQEVQQYDGTRGRGITGTITAQLEAEAKDEEDDEEKGAEVARSAV